MRNKLVKFASLPAAHELRQMELLKFPRLLFYASSYLLTGQLERFLLWTALDSSGQLWTSSQIGKHCLVDIPKSWLIPNGGY